MRTLIDTDVLSEARKPDGHAIVKQRLAAADPGYLFIGAVSIGEVAHGIARPAGDAPPPARGPPAHGPGPAREPERHSFRGPRLKETIVS